MDNFTDRDRRAAELLIHEAGNLLRHKPEVKGLRLSERELAKYSIANLVDTLANRRPVSANSSFEGEVSAEIAKAEGRELDPFRPTVPWSVFQRDLTTATGSSLVAERTAAPVLVLRPWSVVLAGGCTVLDGLVGDLNIPKSLTSPTAQWVSDTDIITESQPTVGTVELRPKTVAARIEYTRQLPVQTDLKAFLRRSLLRELSRVLDVAAIAGSATGGEPAGIIGSSGVGTWASGALAWSGILAMLQGVSGAADDNSLLWLMPPAVWTILMQREIGSAGAGVVMANDKIAGKRAIVSSSMPAATLIVGSFSELAIGFRGTGVSILVHPFNSATHAQSHGPQQRTQAAR